MACSFENRLIRYKDLDQEIGSIQFFEILGEGHFSDIYKMQFRGKAGALDHSVFSIKVTKSAYNQNVLKHEKSIYDRIDQCKASSHVIQAFQRVKLFDIEQETMRFGLVLEYGGISLKEAEELNWFDSIERAARVGSQILAGLITLESVGVIHTDLKEENILINRSKIVKICDFGSSFILQEGVLRFPIDSEVTTVTHRPPEHDTGFFGCREVGKRYDMWGFAVVIFRLLFKQNPFIFPDWNECKPGSLENLKQRFCYLEQILTAVYPPISDRIVVSQQWLIVKEYLRLGEIAPQQIVRRVSPSPPGFDPALASRPLWERRIPKEDKMWSPLFQNLFVFPEKRWSAREAQCFIHKLIPDPEFREQPVDSFSKCLLQ